MRLWRWGLFNLVGVGGFVTQLAALALFMRLFDWPVLAATAAALELAALQNFIVHSRWTWRDRMPVSLRGWLARFWRYQLAKTASLAGNLAMTLVLASAGLPPEVANTVAVLICAIPNYLISDSFVFQRGT